MTQTTINLNADLGESFGVWHMGDDAALLQVVGSANIACGFHAGDPVVMRDTVRLALSRGVSLGAHPAFPDLQGFGRRAMQLSAKELEATILYQVGALQAMAAAEGGRVTHVKPHGALSNIACANTEVAATVARAVPAKRKAVARGLGEAFIERQEKAVPEKAIPQAAIRYAARSSANIAHLPLLLLRGVVTCA